MGIRMMRAEDIQAVSRMVVDSFLNSVADSLSGRGVSTFMQIASAASFAERMDGTHRLWVCEEEGEILGMIEIREARHVAMLFVVPRRQRAGVGRALVEEALKHCTGPSVTVNASLTSVGAYESYGFRIAGPEEETRGLRYRPMCRPLTVPAASSPSPGGKRE